MSYKLSTDIGGTFTDLVVYSKDGSISNFKSPTTPDNYWKGIINVIEIAANHFKKPINEFLNQCDSFVHGSTISTNAILTDNVAKTGLICTNGFKNILTMREGGKRDPFNFKVDFPKPYIEQHFTLPVIERINSEGEVEIALDEQSVREAIKKFKRWGIESIAVSLLWSISNAKHEKRIGEIIKEEWPEVPYSLSHEVNPSIREYRRTSSTAIDASLKPIVGEYMTKLANKIKENGYNETMLAFNSTGGLMPVNEIINQPINTVDCGTALAPISGSFYSKEEIDEENSIVIDMGGTSLDISCITEGKIATTRESKVGTGDYILGIDKVDTRSIGAGGGSIAWVDSGGMLQVGPQSAGSKPGPACYGQGGTEPTVTDANVILGYIDPENFVGGTTKLDSKLAFEAMSNEVSNHLSVSDYESAFAVWNVVNTNMIAAIKEMTIWQGIDPREYLFVSGGGAGGLHAVAIAQELEAKRVLIPKVAGGLSAAGGIFGEIKSDFNGSLFTQSNNFDFDGVNGLLEKLKEKATSFFDRTSVDQKYRKFDHYVEARYAGQIWEIPVPLKNSNLKNQNDLNQLINDFHEEHERVFTIKEPTQNIELLNWSIKARGEVPNYPTKKNKKGGKSSDHALKGHREIYIKELNKLSDTPVYNGNLLITDNEVVGPAIIEEDTTTILIPKSCKATVTDLESYLIEVGIK